MIYFSLTLDLSKNLPKKFSLLLSIPSICDHPYVTTISAPKEPNKSGLIKGAISDILVLS